MKKILFAAAISLAAAAPVMAADMPVKAPPMAAPVAVSYAWTGCYIGGHVGILRARKHWYDEDEDVGGHTASGIMGGGQIGCDWQRDRIVFGILVDGSWSNADGEHTFEGITGRSLVRGLGSVSGRIGITWTPAWLIYVTGGWAWERDRHEVTDGEEFAWANKTRHGWTIGFGSEFSLGNNWSFFSQSNYYNFGTRDVAFTGDEEGVLRIRETKWTWRVGLNYRFGGGGIVSARN